MVHLATQTISVEGFTLGLATVSRFFTSLTKPIWFPCRYNGFHVKICLDDILVLTHSKHASKMAWIPLCSSLSSLGLHIIFTSLDFISLCTFFFWTMLGHSGHVSVFAIWQTSWDTAVGLFFITEAISYNPLDFVLFEQDLLLCQAYCTTLPVELCHWEWYVDCLPFFSSFMLSFHLFLPEQCQL